MSVTGLHLFALAVFLAMAIALVISLSFSARIWRAYERARKAFGELRSAYRRRFRAYVRMKKRERRRIEREREREREHAQSGERPMLRGGNPNDHETLARREPSTIRPPPLADEDWSDDALLTEEVPDIHDRRTRVMRRPPREK